MTRDAEKCTRKAARLGPGSVLGGGAEACGLTKRDPCVQTTHAEEDLPVGASTLGERVQR